LRFAYAFGFGIAAASLAACGDLRQGPTGVAPLTAAGGFSRIARGTASYQVVFRFDRRNGEAPVVGLTPVDGTLYGTTFEGGAVHCDRNSGCGAAYSITPSGSETLIYSFNGDHGVGPESPLIDVNGTFYGTTQRGGTSIYGAFFSLTPSGTETVLHDFHLSRPDGQFPEGGLLNLNGTMYGTTEAGGHVVADPHCKRGCGSVYSMTTAGEEEVLYRFRAGDDGSVPSSGLIDVHATLYGVTRYGGTIACSYGQSCGTVYSITPKGVYKQLYRFAGGSDGANPSGELLDVNGLLYGTTTGGGASGNGTVYTMTTAGKEQVIYSFAGGSDGAYPRARLIDVNGTLYGTTGGGGNSSCAGGCGTVYSITPAGAETVLYRFAGGSDGMSPAASLINIKGTLYGTTAGGGDGRKNGPEGCCGTVFALRP